MLKVLRPGIRRVIPALFLFALALFGVEPVQATEPYTGKVYDCRDYNGNVIAGVRGSDYNACKSWTEANVFPPSQYNYQGATLYSPSGCPNNSSSECWHIQWRRISNGSWKEMRALLIGSGGVAGCTYIDPNNNNTCTDTDPAQICADRLGTAKTMTGTGGWAGKPQTFKDPETGCLLEDAGGIAMLLGDGSTWSGTYTYTGVLANTEPAGTETTKTTQGGSTTCSTSAAGNTLCVDDLNPNCMTLNGSQVCGASSPGSLAPKLPSDGTCRTYATGEICESGAINTPVDGFGNPVAKDSTQIGAGSSSGGQVQYDYYPNGDGDTSTGAGESGLGAGGTGTDTIKIDGSDVPGWSDGGAGQSGNNAQQGIEDGMASDMGVASTGVTPQTAMPGYAACQSITVDVFGHSFTWPSANTCTKMEAIKTLVAWFFYALTALYLFRLATRKPG